MYVSSKKAQEFYNVSGETLRIWSEKGKIKFKTTKGGHRRYFVKTNFKEKRKSIIYARVSSNKQKFDLERQIEFVQQKYPKNEVIKDIGSGLNFKRQGFISLLDEVLNGCIKTIVVTDKDRLVRFGFELFEYICKRHGTKIIILSKQKKKEFSEELTDDLMAIITVFSARYYGKRRHKVL